MIELFDELRTCDDVRALGTRGIGEGPMMDYKESISFREQGTLTEGAKKELARDVSALANAQGGLLVIGVKDPAREGVKDIAEATEQISNILQQAVDPRHGEVRVSTEAERQRREEQDKQTTKRPGPR